MKGTIKVVVFIVVAIFLLGIFFDRGPGLLPTRSNSRDEPKGANEQISNVTEANDANVSLEAGETIFNNNCAARHGKTGKGIVGPALAGNEKLADTAHVVKRILNGGGPMPAWKNRLLDEEIASVASYIRGSWGNEFSDISTTDVAAER
jgi:mono/diheme cytochrome c family protein